MVAPFFNFVETIPFQARLFLRKGVGLHLKKLGDKIDMFIVDKTKKRRDKGI